MMNIQEFKFVEMFNNSKGKTSLALVCGGMSITTGCFMGVYAVISSHEGLATQGLGFVGAGATLLGIRRFTADKELDVPQTTKVTNTVTDSTEIISPKQV